MASRSTFAQQSLCGRPFVSASQSLPTIGPSNIQGFGARGRSPISGLRFASPDYTIANGKRLRVTFLVPCSPAGHRAGDSVTRLMARSTSAANLTAAVWFRSRYQVSADLNSARAEGWISSVLPAIEDGCDLPPGVGPGNRLHFAGVQFFDAAGNFLAPSLFGRRVQSIVQALEERTCQRCPGFCRERQSLFQQLGNLFCHTAILLLRIPHFTTRSNHASVCTSTDSTPGKSRTMGAQLSPASAEAYIWPPVVPKYTPHLSSESTAIASRNTFT